MADIAEPSGIPPKIALVMRRDRGSRGVLRAEGAILPLVLLALVLVSTATAGLVPFGVGFLLALVPVPLVIAVLLRLDRFEPEPTRLLARTFLWGAGAATFLAMVVNEIVGAAAGEWAMAVVSAPIAEEVAKALALLFVIRKRPGILDGVHDGIVYAAWVGLGFATVENILYYGAALIEDGAGGLTAVFVLRGLMLPLCHPIFTAMTGIGLGLAVASRRGRAVKLLLFAAGLMLAILLHALWNASTYSDAVVIAYLVGYLPLAAVGIAILVLGARRERRILRTGLEVEVGRGTISRDEYAILTAGGRSRGRLRRRARRAGRGARRLLHVYETAAYELAHLEARGLRPGADADPVAVAASYRACLLSARGGLRNIDPSLLPA